MKFLRFLWGFICGVWTLIVAVVAFMCGGASGFALGTSHSPRRVSYNSTYDKGT